VEAEPAGELKLTVGPLDTFVSIGDGRNATGEDAAVVFPSLGHVCHYWIRGLR
jgi:hypothetical protein